MLVGNGTELLLDRVTLFRRVVRVLAVMVLSVVSGAESLGASESLESLTVSYNTYTC
jgi:hypothetical protein